MAYSLSSAGAEIHFTTVDKISWSSGYSHPTAQTQPLLFGEGAASARAGHPEKMLLSDYQCIHMRKDPPFDLNYIAVTWILSALPPTTKVLNAPDALRSFNEKLLIMHYPEFRDEVIVSSDPADMLDFIIENCNNSAVLKPLDLYAGKGILKLEVSPLAKPLAGATSSSSPDILSQKQALNVLEKETNSGQIKKIIQPYNPAITKGEIRAFAAGGEAVSYCLKVPKEGSFLANTGSGANLEPFDPPEHIENMVNKVAKDLLRHGVFLVGLDIIGSFISEINITSPRLLLPPGTDDEPFYNVLADKILEFASPN